MIIDIREERLYSSLNTTIDVKSLYVVWLYDTLVRSAVFLKYESSNEWYVILNFENSLTDS